jgi:hypothetical protein
VVVGDDDLGPVDVVQHVGRYQLAAGLIASCAIPEGC